MAEPWLYDRALVLRLEAALDEQRLRRGNGPDLRELIGWFHAPGGPLFSSAANPSAASARAIASAAWVNLSVAFSLWSHRMVLEYLAASEQAYEPTVRAALERGTLAGSSALASGMAHYVTGAELPIYAQRGTNQLVCEGRVRWASNLFDSGFLLVTALNVQGEGPRVVAVRAPVAGLSADPFPALLELEETKSSSLRLRNLELPGSAVLARDFSSFIERVRPRFLLLQSCFCWGLAARSLHESLAGLKGVNEVFATEHRSLEAELSRIHSALEAGLRALADEPPLPIFDLVSLRLDAARLAGAATRLESKLAGGAGFVATSGTARRLREGAFLPVQSPTEGQLLWEVSRSS